jgi:hypothetical protein
LYEF